MENPESHQIEVIKNRVEPRYDLTTEELAELELGLVGVVKEKYPEDGIYAVWIPHDNPYANILRAYESRYFPEVADVTEEEEESSIFLALVDTRQDEKRVVHGATISSGFSLKGGENGHSFSEVKSDKTGFIVVDDLIELDNFNAQEFYKYYQNQGIELDKCISVETNFRVGEKTEPFNGATPAQLAYTTIFNKLTKKRPAVNKAAVFSSINRASILSFQRIGLQCEPLMGRRDLKTPEQELGKDFAPVAILYSDKNIAIFNHLGPKLPEVDLEPAT